MNSNFSSHESLKNLSNSSSNSSSSTSIDSICQKTYKQNIIHERLLRIIEKKIKHNVELEDHDIDYINYDCEEKDQRYFMEVYNKMVQDFKPFCIENAQNLTPSLLKSAHDVGVFTTK